METEAIYQRALTDEKDTGSRRYRRWERLIVYELLAFLVRQPQPRFSAKPFPAVPNLRVGHRMSTAVQLLGINTITPVAD